MTNPDPTKQTSHPTKKTSRRLIWITCMVVLIAAVVIGGIVYVQGKGNGTSTTSATDSQMVARAQQVMPFDLNNSTHTFTKTNSGGVEKVVANSATDGKETASIRSHLSMVAGMFQAGNYSDPAEIHGMNMPGLSELEANAAQTKITYSSIPGGGQITYSSSVPSFVSAIHAFFDRQSADHSMPGMGG